MAVYAEIVAWSASRPAWQRDALRRLATGGALQPGDVDELADIAAGRTADGNAAPAAQPLAAAHVPGSGGTPAGTSVLSISPTNVNALSTTASLTFAPTGMTVVYGDNGAGKSGYVRILKSVCRARGAREHVLPNVFAAGASPTSATIDYCAAGSRVTRDWAPGDSAVDPLGTVSVFDRTCAAVYVTGESEVAYRPLGLDLLDSLGKAARDVRAVLDARRTSVRRPRLAVPADLASAAVVAAAWPVADGPSPAVVRTAAWSDVDQARLDLVQAALDDRGDPDRRAGVVARQAQLRAASRACRTAAGVGPAAARLLAAVRGLEVAESAAAAGRASASDPDPLAAVGGVRWRAMWNAAERYSAADAYPGHAFPHVADGARCVLCAQALGLEAAGRLQALRRLVDGELEAAVASATEAVESSRAALQSAVEQIAATLDNLALTEPDSDLSQRVADRLARAESEGRAALSGDATTAAAEPAPAPEPPDQQVEDRLNELTEQLVLVDRALDPAGSAELQAEAVELRGRKWLVDNRGLLLEEVERAALLRALDLAVDSCDTAQITTQAGRLTEEHVTAALRAQFELELQQLKPGRVEVRIERRGGYGAAFHHLELAGMAGRSTARVADVVSDGEFRAVALASFLAEVAASDSPSAVVLDDPVTSLDHLYRERAARRLADEAARRQVIVFTHDLVFLSDLVAATEAAAVPVEFRTVRKVGPEAGIAAEGHPWLSMKVNARLQALDERIGEIARLHESGDMAAYGREVAHWYSDLRATWERAVEEILFGDVVGRFRAQVKTQSLSSLQVWRMEEADIRDLDAAMTKASDMTEAHDAPAAVNREPPPPSELRRDVQQCRAWAKRIRDRRTR